MSDYFDNSSRELDRDQIMVLLTDLGAKLKAQNLSATVNVVGGAAIALTLKDGRVTQDVDAFVVADHQREFGLAALEVAEEHNIRHDWIGDDISEFVSRSPEGEQTEIQVPGLAVYVASPEHLLAMKVRASVSRYEAKDAADMVFLADHLKLESPQEIAALTARQFQGLYQDNIGVDEYVATVKDAFMVHDIESGVDPLVRWAKNEKAESDHASRFPELFADDDAEQDSYADSGYDY